MKISRENQIQNDSNDESWLYNIHHIHHFLDIDFQHEVHHCFLYEKMNKQGNKFEVQHFIDGDNLYHTIEDDFMGNLYDHSNNKYLITKTRINQKEIFVINQSMDVTP